MTFNVLIVGVGPMAEAHAAVMKALGTPLTAVCRSPDSAQRFIAATGCEAMPGGLAVALTANVPERAIVATAVQDLADCTIQLIESGCRSILVEKPAGVTARDIARVSEAARARNCEVHVAYNRRFYASVRKAREFIEEDAGVLSFTFEFTEVGDRIALLPYPPEVLANWELANSTHVIDTAFHLCGIPKAIHGLVAGSLPWHPRCARFTGHGLTENGAAFAYFADWDAPGRWGIEINTAHRRLVLRPMEKLQAQYRGKFTIDEVEIDDALDKRFKPGLYRQAEAWLGRSSRSSLIGIHDHSQAIAKIARNIMMEKEE